MKPVYASKALTQAQQAAQVLTMIWAPGINVASLDAVRICMSRGITRADLVRQIGDAVAARKARV